MGKGAGFVNYLFSRLIHAIAEAAAPASGRHSRAERSQPAASDPCRTTMHIQTPLPRAIRRASLAACMLTAACSGADSGAGFSTADSAGVTIARNTTVAGRIDSLPSPDVSIGSADAGGAAE